VRLIVTRPRADAGPLGRRLAAGGHEVIMAPLLSIRPVDSLAIPERAYQAVLMTSANSARALAGRPRLERLKGAAALVVGPSSAAAAASAGFARIEQADGDVAALARLAIATLRPEHGPLLYVSGAVTAGDLASALEASGFAVDRVVAYEARPVAALPKACAAALAAGKADGILLFSPRSARIWTTLVGAADLTAAAAKLVHYCLSENVAGAVCNALGPDVVVQVPPRPEEAALLEMIPAPA
jgi:uroporphyrinogen-III synthase